MKYCQKHKCEYLFECQQCIIEAEAARMEDIDGAVLAKYAGWCRLCGSPIRAGHDYISRIDGEWYHTECVELDLEP